MPAIFEAARLEKFYRYYLVSYPPPKGSGLSVALMQPET